MLSYRKGTFSDVPDSLAIYQTYTAKSKQYISLSESSVKITSEAELLGHGITSSDGTFHPKRSQILYIPLKDERTIKFVKGYWRRKETLEANLKKYLKRRVEFEIENVPLLRCIQLNLGWIKY